MNPEEKVHLENESKPPRECRRCLVRELAGSEDILGSIQAYIANLEPSERLEGEAYEKRLLRCRECDYLISGMCRACGCYVELRAAKSAEECPYDKW